MTINIIGDAQPVKRIVTGMYSFDKAFENRKGDLGFPVGRIAEISGPTGVGKSTFVFGLSGLIAHEFQQNIAMVDLEGFDPVFLTTILEKSNFDGKVNYIQEIEDEVALDDLISSISSMNEKYRIGILDSVGAVSPISEVEGELGEANMGRRAKLMAQFARKAARICRSSKDDPRSFFLVNHAHAIIGGRGLQTVGGETLKYISAIRIRLKRKEEFIDGSYVLEGTVFKNRFGYKDKVFHLVMLAGVGIHKGLTWMYDGFLTEGCGVERGKVVKVSGQSMGHLKTIFEKAYIEGESEFFLPFKEALSANVEANKETENESVENIERDANTEE